MILNCDWLQLYVDYREWRPTVRYTYTDLDVSSNIFGRVTEVYRGRDKIAMMAYDPKSPIIAPSCGLLKIINSALYRVDSATIVADLLNDHHIKVLSVSRADIAGDFQQIGPYLNPASLIRDVLLGNIVHVGKSKGQLSGMATHPRKDGQPYAAIWRGHGLEQPRYEYLRYGKRSSNVATYMYDKTVEMEDVKLKPYIVDKWQRNGLMPDRAHVWRLEFSLKPSQLSLVFHDNDQLLYRWQSYLDPWCLSIIYYSIAHKYFRFVDPHTATRVARCKEIQLFGPNDGIGKISEKEPAQDSDRSIRTFLNKMHKINDELRTEQNSVRLMTQYLLAHYTADTALQDWAKRKGINLNDAPSIDDIKAAIDNDTIKDGEGNE